MRRAPSRTDAEAMKTSPVERAATTSADGTTIGWVSSGRGPALLLVHGGGADHTRLAATAAHLSDRFTVHRVDRRGRGMSGDSADYSVEREYDDIASVADAIGGDVTVVGHSYGGPITLGAATRSAAIAGVVCYEGWPGLPGDPPSYDPGDVPDRIQGLVDAGDRDGAVVVLLEDLLGVGPAQIEQMRAEPWWAGRMVAAPALPRELRTEPTITLPEHVLRSVTTPVLLLIGGQNEADLRESAERLCSLLPAGRIGVLPGQGHLAMDTAPVLFEAALVEFAQRG